MRKTFSLFTNHFLKSELLTSATVLISGTIAAQLISILLQPVIRRLFTPESFGTYSVYLSIVGILITFSSLRYDEAIVLPKSDKESTNLMGLALMTNMVINLFILLIVIIIGERMVKFLNLPENFPPSILLLMPLGAMIFSAYGSVNAWLIRKKKYLSVSVNKLVRRSAEGASQIGLAVIKLPHGLIYSDLIGQAANLATAVLQTARNGLNMKMISKSKLKYVLRKYSDFPKYNLIPALMSTCSYLLPPILINKYFSSESAGLFDLSKLVLSIPLAFIAASLASVLLQKISEKYNRKESFIGDLKPVILTVGLIAAGEILIIVLFGQSLFRFVFGEQWSASGVISRIMVWSFAISFIVSSFSSVFISLRRIKTYSIWQAIYFLLIISLTLFRNLAFMDFLKIYVAIEVLCYIAAALIMAAIIWKYESGLNKS